MPYVIVDGSERYGSGGAGALLVDGAIQRGTAPVILAYAAWGFSCATGQHAELAAILRGHAWALEILAELDLAVITLRVLSDNDGAIKIARADHQIDAIYLPKSQRGKLSTHHYAHCLARQGLSELDGWRFTGRGEPDFRVIHEERIARRRSPVLAASMAIREAREGRPSWVLTHRLPRPPLEQLRAVAPPAAWDVFTRGWRELGLVVFHATRPGGYFGPPKAVSAAAHADVA